jgi:catechol 2,3-dioxygenase-like lactoylglutathione lyase family enzyme
MDYQLQVVTLSVSDVDKAADFYTRQAGFTLDVDYHPTPGFRVVQLTPPGSACSIQLGVGLTDAPPGSARSTYLAVTDIEAACQELAAAGVKISGIRHKSSIDNWTGGWQPGTDPARRDYASLADFADPDGNTWVIQEIGYRPPPPAAASPWTDPGVDTTADPRADDAACLSARQNIARPLVLP